jgi:hypothetical protein
LVLWYSRGLASDSLSEHDSAAVDSQGIVQHRGFFKTVGTVVSQVGVGLLTGSGGLALTGIHPIVGGVGWIVGSSYGVYAIGDEGTGRGDFWWTAAAGSGVVFALTPALVGNKGIGGVMAAGLGIVASLTAEIIVYHITEAPFIPRASVSVRYIDLAEDWQGGPSAWTVQGHSLSPCFTVCFAF